MFAKEMQRRLAGTGVDVFANNPGMVATPLVDKIDTHTYWTGALSWALGKTVGQRQPRGASSLVYTAMAPELQGATDTRAGIILNYVEMRQLELLRSIPTAVCFLLTTAERFLYIDIMQHSIQF